MPAVARVGPHVGGSSGKSCAQRAFGGFLVAESRVRGVVAEIGRRRARPSGAPGRATHQQCETNSRLRRRSECRGNI